LQTALIFIFIENSNICIHAKTLKGSF
jgi:hypothetical protein